MKRKARRFFLAGIGQNISSLKDDSMYSALSLPSAHRPRIVKASLNFRSRRFEPLLAADASAFPFVCFLFIRKSFEQSHRLTFADSTLES